MSNQNLDFHYLDEETESFKNPIRSFPENPFFEGGPSLQLSPEVSYPEVSCSGDPCSGDPCSGDPCSGDPCSGDPCPGDFSSADPSEILTTKGYNAYATISSTTQPEIVNALSQLPIENEVISKAIEIFYRLRSFSGRILDQKIAKTKSIKGNRKIRCMFYCVFTAYEELGVPVDPNYAAELVGLSDRKIDQAFKEYSTEPKVIAPELLVRFYIKRINQLISNSGVEYDLKRVEYEVSKIIEICRSSPEGLEWVNNTPAKTVAIVALFFYMNDVMKLEVAHKITIFEQACYLSWACIRRYHEQFVKYYNNDINRYQTILKSH